LNNLFYASSPGWQAEVYHNILIKSLCVHLSLAYAAVA